MAKNNIVVGWGLAGVTLGWELYFRGESFTVFDTNKADSTRTAAGLINPIVFKRQNLSWMADRLLPKANAFYTKVEQELDAVLVSRKNIFRVFSSVEEENNWSVKQGDDRYRDYLKTPKTEDLPSLDKVAGPYGFGEVDTIGYLDTNSFIDISKIFFRNKGIEFFEEAFPFSRLDGGFSEQVFFCEGVGVFNNNLFNYLPLKGTHGETLVIETEDYRFESVLNKNMYLLPVGKNRYKIGATYNWDLKTPVITPEAKAELIERLEAFTNFKYKVVEQKAGVRPTVVDRKPLLGVHPKNQNAYIFNGLGTKGVMLAPFFANQLLDFVFLNGALDKEVDIKRHEQKYFSENS